MCFGRHLCANMLLRRVLVRSHTCAPLLTRIDATIPLLSENFKGIHTTERKETLEVVAGLGMGYLMNANWADLHSYVKVATTTIPLVAAAVLAMSIRSKTVYDPLLQRKKTLLHRYSPMPPFITYLDGAGVDKANQLLMQLISANLASIPSLGHPSHNWQVLVSDEDHLWIDTTDRGQIMFSKKILTNLSRNELTFLMATLVAHVVAKHKTEVVSSLTIMHRFAGIAAWYYAFNAPVIHSYPADILTIYLIYNFASYAIFQLKYRKLCLEADILGFRMAGVLGTEVDDGISAMKKLIEIRAGLPLPTRVKASCHYKYRMAALSRGQTSRLASNQ